MKGRILIIEDNPTNLELMAYLLSTHGYEVLSAVDGEKGLASTIADRPDLIICDLQMPGLTGYDLAREVRRRERASEHTPMLAVTAYAMIDDRQRSLEAGFDGYISKPIEAETFVSEVEVFLPAGKRSRGAPQAHRPNVCVRTSPREPVQRAAILVVDDSPINLSLVRETLEPRGFSITAAASVDAAMEEAHRNSFDLILSDLHMPNNSGLELVRRVRADAALLTIPVILFTASTTDPRDGEQERALSMGADRFLFRPIDPSVLLAEIETCIAERERKG